jgi:hypothetical protein
MKTKNKNMRIYKLGFFVFFSVIIAGCSAKKHIDKAVMKESPKFVIEYIISKYGSSYLDAIKDTIRDTVIVYKNRIDTIFYLKKETDTVYVKDTRNRDTIIRIIKKRDTLYVTKYKTQDTVIITKYYPKYIVEKKDTNAKKESLFDGIIDVIFVAAIMCLILFIMMKLNSKTKQQ